MSSDCETRLDNMEVEMGAISLRTPTHTPLTPLTPKKSERSDVDDSFLVTFKEPVDIDNPKDWPPSRKWAVTNVLSATGFNRVMVSTVAAPALSTVAHQLNMSTTEAMLSFSSYLLATAFGPLIFGPLSEMYGREIILHVSNVWFLVWNLVCGFANSKELLIASRFLDGLMLGPLFTRFSAGFGASAIFALAGGVLGDMWRPEQRGRSLGVFLLIPVLGAAVGPIVGGFIVARTTWRWVFWATSIFQGLMIAFSFSTFHETYAPIILHRKAEKIRRKTGDLQFTTAEERLHKDKPIHRALGRALIRPLKLLALHPIIQVTSVISAFYFGILYIVLATFSDLWTTRYDQSSQISSLHYIAYAFGEISGSQLGGPLMDALYRRMTRNSEHTPEMRIPLIFPGAVVAPLGLFIYGWTSQFEVLWIAVDIGIFVALFGMQIIGMAIQAYVMDCYPDHVSSAVAATQFMRSLAAFAFPLFAPRMYEVLGYGWGNSAMAFAGLFIGVPAPLVLWMFGSRLRAKALSSY